MFTPWGNSDGQTTLAPGIVSYSTPSHGGIHVDAELNQVIHEAWRSEEGWYEEDCEWAKVAFHFPLAFKPEDRAMAIKTLKGWDPYKYMEVTGEKICPIESNTIIEDAWNKAHENDLKVICASGDWLFGVPDGMVYVTVVRPKDLNPLNNCHEKSAERYFLVPKGEYTIPFAIADEKKYKEVSEITEHWSKCTYDGCQDHSVECHKGRSYCWSHYVKVVQEG